MVNCFSFLFFFLIFKSLLYNTETLLGIILLNESVTNIATKIFEPEF